MTKPTVEELFEHCKQEIEAACVDTESGAQEISGEHVLPWIRVVGRHWKAGWDAGHKAALRERLAGEQSNGWLPLRDAPEFVHGRDALVGQWTERGWQKVTIWEHFWTRNQCIDRGATHWWPHLSELPPPSPEPSDGK